MHSRAKYKYMPPQVVVSKVLKMLRISKHVDKSIYRYVEVLSVPERVAVAEWNSKSAPYVEVSMQIPLVLGP